MLMVPASRITQDKHRVADMTGLPMEDIVGVLHEISVIKGTDIGFHMERFRYTWIGSGEYFGLIIAKSLCQQVFSHDRKNHRYRCVNRYYGEA